MAKTLIIPGIVVLLFCFFSSGCATYRTIESASPGSPKFFSGTRLDVNAIKNNKVAMKKFNAKAPEYPLLDLPASILADLIISPLSFGVAIYESITHQ